MSVYEYLVNEGSSVVLVIRGYLPKLAADIVLAEIKDLEYKQYPSIVPGKMQPRLNWGCGDEKIVSEYLPDSGKYSGVSTKHPWLLSLKIIRDRILKETAIVYFNSCIINLYRDGSDWIPIHADREALGVGNTVVTISLNGSRDFQVIRNSDNHKVETTLHHGDLCLMFGETQKTHKHSIKKTAKYVEPRYALTYRFLS